MVKMLQRPCVDYLICHHILRYLSQYKYIPLSGDLAPLARDLPQTIAYHPSWIHRHIQLPINYYNVKFYHRRTLYTIKIE